jgi:hypothetical protein
LVEEKIFELMKTQNCIKYIEKIGSMYFLWLLFIIIISGAVYDFYHFIDNAKIILYSIVLILMFVILIKEEVSLNKKLKEKELFFLKMFYLKKYLNFNIFHSLSGQKKIFKKIALKLISEKRKSFADVFIESSLLKEKFTNELIEDLEKEIGNISLDDLTKIIDSHLINSKLSKKLIDKQIKLKLTNKIESF